MDSIVPSQLYGKFAVIAADDHPSVSLAVGQICVSWLGVDSEHITSAHSSRELLAICSTPSALPRIIVLDLVMPGTLKRASLVRAVCRADPKARVVVYSADESAFLVKAVMEAGAMGYVCKISPTTELVEAIVAVSEGRSHVDKFIDLDAIQSHAWAKLTKSERSVLLAFSRGEKADDIVTNTGRSYSTVMTHKYNGLSKLDLRDGTDLLPYLYANGLIYALDDDESNQEVFS